MIISLIVLFVFLNHMHFVMSKFSLCVYRITTLYLFETKKFEGCADDRILSQTYDNNETLKSMYFCYICSWTPGILNLSDGRLI